MGSDPVMWARIPIAYLLMPKLSKYLDFFTIKSIPIKCKGRKSIVYFATQAYTVVHTVAYIFKILTTCYKARRLRCNAPREDSV